MKRPGVLLLSLISAALAVNVSPATSGQPFQRAAVSALRTLGGRVQPCPDVGTYQVSVCAISRLDALQLRKKLQVVPLFKNIRSWTPVESMVWAPFKFQGREAYVIVAPLPDRTTIIEVGLGRFEP